MNDAEGHARGSGGGARPIAAIALMVLACVLAPLSVFSVWASTVISDTDRYVETVAPVADDPGVRSAIADEVTAAIMENLDVAGLTTAALDTLAAQEDMPPRVADALPALAVPLARGIEDFTRTQAAGFVSSREFEPVWAEVNRIAHARVVTLLEGNEGGAVTAQADQITLNLAPVIEEVRSRLVDQGFALADRIPIIDRTFVLVESERIGQAQRVYSALDTLGVWLPLVAVGLFVAGVLLARDRRRAVLTGALGVSAAMVALGVGLTLVRVMYVETTPAGVLTAESAGNVFDTLVRFLRTGLRITAVLALLVALATVLTGPASARWHLDHVGSWVSEHKRGLRMAAFLAGGLTLMFWTRPTAWVVVLVVLLVVLALTVIAFLSRPRSPARPVPPKVTPAG